MSYLRTSALLVVFFTLATLILPHQVQAVTVFDSFSAWQTAVGSYNPVNSLDAIADYASINSFALPSGTNVNLSETMTLYSIGSGWATWSGTYAGKVLFTGSLSIVNTFNSPVYGFGLEMEPNYFQDYSMTLLLNDGSYLTQDVNGSYGAKFFGWAGGPVTTMTLSAVSDSGGFAFGNMVECTHAVPEPTTLSLLGLGLLGLLRRKRKI